MAALFAQFEFNKSQVLIQTFDSQTLLPPSSTQKDGVLVVVTGTYTAPAKPQPKRFVQAFVLASKERRYYIFNDILRAEFADSRLPASPAGVLTQDGAPSAVLPGEPDRSGLAAAAVPAMPSALGAGHLRRARGVLCEKILRLRSVRARGLPVVAKVGWGGNQWAFGAAGLSV